MISAPSEIYTLSLHDALPIFAALQHSYDWLLRWLPLVKSSHSLSTRRHRDRKSTRLNSSHTVISYAVFCLKKKTNRENPWSPQCVLSIDSGSAWTSVSPLKPK